MEELLRVCKECGKKAFTKLDLESFCTDKKMLYGRQNLCKECYNKRIQKGGRYYEKQLKTSLAWKHRNKEQLKKYDKERYERFPNRFKNHRERRIKLDDRVVYVEENPRKGFCFFCGTENNKEGVIQNSIHHWAYDKDDYVAYSIELCGSCHKRLPQTVWVECECDLKYDGWLYNECPKCKKSNPIFTEIDQQKYISKIVKLL